MYLTRSNIDDPLDYSRHVITDGYAVRSTKGTFGLRPSYSVTGRNGKTPRLKFRWRPILGRACEVNILLRIAKSSSGVLVKLFVQFVSRTVNVVIISVAARAQI
ncbi:hypothetical protein GWI33_006525 [Rhynchophorus ferrugineus]|uniref:Uncharacterized protein n=1 Tax=Rhynchophorus ferrugineus TaxID=354439 RepID=A0A834MIV9_RHYFE|nr:hypothetical protein GWI33_006525 [Rhynchophorus ferrugineus]